MFCRSSLTKILFKRWNIMIRVIHEFSNVLFLPNEKWCEIIAIYLHSQTEKGCFTVWILWSHPDCFSRVLPHPIRRRHRHATLQSTCLWRLTVAAEGRREMKKRWWAPLKRLKGASSEPDAAHMHTAMQRKHFDCCCVCSHHTVRPPGSAFPLLSNTTFKCHCAVFFLGHTWFDIKGQVHCYRSIFCDFFKRVFPTLIT